jgi:hypothetical protein
VLFFCSFSCTVFKNSLEGGVLNSFSLHISSPVASGVIHYVYYSKNFEEVNKTGNIRIT